MAPVCRHFCRFKATSWPKRKAIGSAGKKSRQFLWNSFAFPTHLLQLLINYKFRVLVACFPAGGWKFSLIYDRPDQRTMLICSHTLYEEKSQIGIPFRYVYFHHICGRRQGNALLHSPQSTIFLVQFQMILLVIDIPTFPVHHLRLLPFSFALRSLDEISFPLSERVCRHHVIPWSSGWLFLSLFFFLQF